MLQPWGVNHRTLGDRCVIFAHDTKPRPAERPSRTRLGKYAPRHDSAHGRSDDDEPSRTARVHATHACARRFVRLYGMSVSHVSDACSPRFRSGTMAPSLAAQSMLAFSRNSTVLRNAVISGTRSYLTDVLSTPASPDSPHHRAERICQQRRSRWVQRLREPKTKPSKSSVRA